MNGKEFIITVVGEGEIIGDQSLLNKKPYSASAIARNNVVLLVLHESVFFERASPEVFQKMFETLATRIWFAYQRFELLKVADPIFRLYAFLTIRYRIDTRNFSTMINTNEGHTFLFSREDLLKMCGLLKVREETIKPFLEDKNIDASGDTLIVKNMKRLLEKTVASKHSLHKRIDDILI